ncbi:MAG: PspC domain protein [Frankiales bacterium]|jgi:phage shock protein PspC (stress-responsive transcriptional regulator)|nr:PspC domain protein [Frankiales bacterium]
MTETAASPAPPRPLYRDRDEGKFAGVCLAVGRWTDTDPLVWRVLTVVLTVFGGTGIVLYALGWLLIPKLGEQASTAQRWLHRDRPLSPLVIVGVVVAAVLLTAGADDTDGLGVVVVLAGMAYLVHRERQGRPLAPPYVPPGEVAAPIAWEPTPKRPRSRLGALTLSATALLGGVLVLLRTYGIEDLTPARILAACLVAVGAGLVVGTWYGRARWLALVGLLLAVALAATAAADSDTLRGGLGERRWAPTTSQDFELGAGEAVLDLTALPAEGPHVVVNARVGVGHLVVLLPEGVPVRVHAVVRTGNVNDVGTTIENGTGRVERTLSHGPAGDPRIEVEALVRAGQVEVRHG